MSQEVSESWSSLLRLGMLKDNFVWPKKIIGKEIPCRRFENVKINFRRNPLRAKQPELLNSKWKGFWNAKTQTTCDVPRPTKAASAVRNQFLRKNATKYLQQTEFSHKSYFQSKRKIPCHFPLPKQSQSFDSLAFIWNFITFRSQSPSEFFWSRIDRLSRLI